MNPAPDKIVRIREQRRHMHRQLLNSKSRVYEAFLALEAAAFADGALPAKTKELMATAIAVALDCESCMEWHITRAARHGATRREVLEAVEVAIEMAGGPATVSARFALEVMDDVFGPAPDESKT